MGRKFYVYAILVVGCIILVIGAVNLHRDPTGTDTNGSGLARAEFINTRAELYKLEDEIRPLKETLASQKNNLAIAVEVIEKNRDCEDETKVAVAAGAEVTLLAVRRDISKLLQKMEALQKEIAQREARISELTKKIGYITGRIEGRQPDEKIPPDIELLKRAGHLLDSKLTAAPTAAK
jgi:chromosome segregation ATPase